MSNNRLYVSICFMLLSWLLAGCTTTALVRQSTGTLSPTNQYHAIKYSELIMPVECSNPCWAGIEVDKTSFSDAKELLIKRYGYQNIESIDKVSLDIKTEGDDGTSQVYILFVNDMVVEITIIFDVSTHFTASEVIEILGDPSWVVVRSNPNNTCLGFDLLYPVMGSYISLNRNENQNGVYPVQQVYTLKLFQTRITENWNVNDGYLVKWEGYKEYCEK